MRMVNILIVVIVFFSLILTVCNISFAEPFQ